VRPDARFTDLPLEFWAHVRSLSEVLGYTIKSKKGTRKLPQAVRVLTPDEIRANAGRLTRK
jgi:biotin operon repressor